MPLTRGTVVKLKSDGPKMTVKAIDGETIRCSWFDGKRLREAEFFDDMLEEDTDLADLLERLKKEKPTSDEGGDSASAKTTGDSTH
jgi:uncharacterized protein YodC (DUF2158 family)